MYNKNKIFKANNNNINTARTMHAGPRFKFVIFLHVINNFSLTPTGSFWLLEGVFWGLRGVLPFL